LTSTRWVGKDVAIYLSTTLEGLDTAPQLSNVESFEWDHDPNFEEEPEGFGYDGTVISEKRASLTASVSRWYNSDNQICCGSTGHTGTCGSTGTFAAVVGAFHVNKNKTPLYLKAYNKQTTEQVILIGCKGKYSRPTDSPEGKIMEKWDIKFTDLDYEETVQ